MASRPLVSVVIPSYNHARFLAETIGSVGAQSYRPLELIVVDDGSTDDSRELARELLPRASLDAAQLLEQENRGAHAAIMRGVAAAGGEHVALLNSDDLYHPRRIETLLPRLASGEHDLAFSGVRFVGAQGEALPPSHAWPSWYRKCLDDLSRCPTVGFGLLAHNFSVSSGNFLFRRTLYDRLGGLSEHRFTHDWDFLLRSIHFSEPAFVPEPLLAYRIHDSNTTETVRSRLADEATDALRRYVELVTAGPSPNPLAPCPQNWPRFFDRFAAELSLDFRPGERLAAVWSQLARRAP